MAILISCPLPASQPSLVALAHSLAVRSLAASAMGERREDRGWLSPPSRAAGSGRHEEEGRREGRKEGDDTKKRCGSENGRRGLRARIARLTHSARELSAFKDSIGISSVKEEGI